MDNTCLKQQRRDTPFCCSPLEGSEDASQMQLILSQHGLLHEARWSGQLSRPVDAIATTAGFGRDSSVFGRGPWGFWNGLKQQKRW